MHPDHRPRRYLPLTSHSNQLYQTTKQLPARFCHPVLTSEPLHKFRLQINTEDYNDTEENGLACVLAFAYTARYPDEAPLVEIEDAVNFEDGFTARLLEHISETVGGPLKHRNKPLPSHLEMAAIHNECPPLPENVFIHGAIG